MRLDLFIQAFLACLIIGGGVMASKGCDNEIRLEQHPGEELEVIELQSKSPGVRCFVLHQKGRQIYHGSGFSCISGER